MTITVLITAKYVQLDFTFRRLLGQYVSENDDAGDIFAKEERTTFPTIHRWINEANANLVFTLDLLVLAFEDCSDERRDVYQYSLAVVNVRPLGYIR